MIHFGDCKEIMQTWPDQSVNCCVTSPPYFGLRDYGHAGQIGLEATPDAYVAKLVDVFREVKRVLRDDGTLWLNIGDSYAANRSYQVPSTKGGPKHSDSQSAGGKGSAVPDGCKPKDLIGIPWRVAFALQADGWYLRQDIIWHKPNPMPESVRDRCTKSHEYLFLLSKSERYYFDAEAIAEPLAASSIERLAQPTLAQQAGSDRVPGKTNGTMKAVGLRPQTARAIELFNEKSLTQAHKDAIRAAGCTDAGKAMVTQTGTGKNTAEVMRLAAEAKAALGGYYREFLSDGTRNKRSVWTVTTKPFKGAHFATFPPDLIEPCILAGCPVGGTVLDPFMGSGTTAKVAIMHGRQYIGCELNPAYKELQDQRIADAMDQKRQVEMEL